MDLKLGIYDDKKCFGNNKITIAVNHLVYSYNVPETIDELRSMSRKTKNYKVDKILYRID